MIWFAYYSLNNGSSFDAILVTQIVISFSVSALRIDFRDILQWQDLLKALDRLSMVSFSKLTEGVANHSELGNERFILALGQLIPLIQPLLDFIGVLKTFLEVLHFSWEIRHGLPTLQDL